MPRGLADLIASLDLSRFELLMVLLVFYIVLGCFLDGISSVVLTMAVVEPMIRQAGIDVIWFGIFIVVVVEMAQITPPIGFNLFVLQGMTHHEMNFIARAAVPMFMIMLLMVFVLIAVPDLATAVRMMTLDAARALRHDHEVGSLEVGKAADLVVVDRDLFAVEAGAIGDAVIEATVVAGRVVYQAPGLAP